jgi:hypothetical protein
MRHLCAITVAVLLVALPATAQEGAQFRLGADAFGAGRTVSHAAAGVDSLFLAGEIVRLEAAIDGTGHLAGRRVEVRAPVGGSLYAAGMDVDIAAPLAGDATLAGYSVNVGAEVGGNLRATGARVVLAAPVGGTALLAGEQIELNAAIAGDAAFMGERMRFGPEARIEGTLRIYSERADAIEVPFSVIDPERITRFDRHEWDRLERPLPRLSWTRILAGYLGAAVVVAGLVALVGAIAPGPLAGLRRQIVRRPFGTFGWGFLALSATVGSAAVLAMTLLGIVLSPAMLLLAGLAGFAGFVVAAYSFGAGLFIAVGQDEPQSLGMRILAGLIGAFLACVLALVPVLGWLFVLALTLIGLGALTLRVLRPQFLVAPRGLDD